MAEIRLGLVAGCWLAAAALQPPIAPDSVARTSSSTADSLALEYVLVQGLRRTVRFYRPEKVAERPALILALHGGGGDGERFRQLTAGAFEQLADQHGFLLAYPDALGGQWKGCRANAPYRDALRGVDEIAFLRAVVRRAAELAGGELAGVFAAGYSNGGHLIFRLALEAPGDFNAVAVIGAHLPMPKERDCGSANTPVTILLVSGTDDPINPWAGGKVTPPVGESPGGVLSANATAEYFVRLLRVAGQPRIEHHPDGDPEDGTRVEIRRWVGQGQAVELMVVHGGGHTLPHPTPSFPADLVGRTSRDLNGAEAIWAFFARHLPTGVSASQSSPTR